MLFRSELAAALPAGGGGVPGVPTLPVPLCELAAALPAGGGGVPGVPTLPVPLCELAAALPTGGGGVPGVPTLPALLRELAAALPAGGGGVPGVPTLPVPLCQLAAALPAGGGGVPGVPNWPEKGDGSVFGIPMAIPSLSYIVVGPRFVFQLIGLRYYDRRASRCRSHSLRYGCGAHRPISARLSPIIFMKTCHYYTINMSLKRQFL